MCENDEDITLNATTNNPGDSYHWYLNGVIIENEENYQFILENNKPALSEIIDRFQEAIDRGLWRPKSNSALINIGKLGKFL